LLSSSLKKAGHAKRGDVDHPVLLSPWGGGKGEEGRNFLPSIDPTRERGEQGEHFSKKEGGSLNLSDYAPHERRKGKRRERGILFVHYWYTI